MDALKKALHPKQTLHKTDDTDDTADTPHTHASPETMTALGNEPNVTGTDRPAPAEDFPRREPRSGHHHPRQPVGATGLPPNHQPREKFTGGGGDPTGEGHDRRQEQQGANMGKVGTILPGRE